MVACHVHTEIYYKLNLKKKLFVINCTNSDRSDSFSQARNKHLMNHKLEMKFLTSENNSMGFFAFEVWGLMPK